MNDNKKFLTADEALEFARDNPALRCKVMDYVTESNSTLNWVLFFRSDSEFFRHKITTKLHAGYWVCWFPNDRFYFKNKGLI